MVKLITLDPGHFHAALVQKKTNPGIDSTVHVYAPEGPELRSHLALIGQYNNQPDATNWNEVVYKGEDYLQKMISEKKGNVVVLAGNNQNKTEYINQSVLAGLNVLADKPMAINKADFDLLLSSFATAEEKGVLLYDIMTERFEITNILMRELAQQREIFGTLKKGTSENPAVVMESIHHFAKEVSGKPLQRPDWFFDPQQQGEPVTDVGTHLVDLVQWICFPDSSIDYSSDIRNISSRLWPTILTKSQFAGITGRKEFPEFLQQYITNDSLLATHANGEINFAIKDIHARIIAKWNYKASEGGDTHYSLLKGTKADLIIYQRAAENFVPELYIIPAQNSEELKIESALNMFITNFSNKYPGLNAEKVPEGWKLVIPSELRTGHEAHFSEVMNRFLNYLNNISLPDWEIPNMKSKYFITTQALNNAISDY